MKRRLTATEEKQLIVYYRLAKTINKDLAAQISDFFLDDIEYGGTRALDALTEAMDGNTAQGPEPQKQERPRKSLAEMSDREFCEMIIRPNTMPFDTEGSAEPRREPRRGAKLSDIDDSAFARAFCNARASLDG